MKDDVAKILDQALTSIWQGTSTPDEWLEKYPQYGDELRALLDTATQIRSLPLPEPSAEFRTQSRLRILRYISLKQAAVPTAAVKRYSRRKPAKRVVPVFRRTALSFAMVVTLLVALMSTGTVYASTGSIPGDTLYPVKIAVEDARLAVSNDEQDTRLYIQFSERRVKEIELLVLRGRLELIPITVARYEKLVEGVAETLPQVSPQALSSEEQTVIRQTISRNTEALTKVLEKVPEPAKPAIQHAIESSSKNEVEMDQFLPLATKVKPSDQLEPTRAPTKTPKATNTPKPRETQASPNERTSPQGESPPEPTREKPTREP